MLGTWALMLSLTVLGMIAAWVPLRSVALPESSRMACVAAAIFGWFLAGAMLADLIGSDFTAELLRLFAAMGSMGAAFATLVLWRHYAELEELAACEEEELRSAATARRAEDRARRTAATEHTLMAIQDLWATVDAAASKKPVCNGSAGGPLLPDPPSEPEAARPPVEQD